MKSLYRCILIVLLICLFGCSEQATFTDAEKETVKKEVSEQFGKVISAINEKDIASWSGHYSQDGFVSAVAGTDYYSKRDAWVNAITGFFATRESQRIEPVAVRIHATARDLALLTAESNSEMKMKDGGLMKVKHVYTMVWKKEPSGWKILHSHESWNAK